jgi:fibronectin-binding autotransporter adhesin
MRQRPAPFHHPVSAAAFAAAILGMSSTAHAATFTWDGGGANPSWGTAANWEPDATPTFDNSADLIFNNLTRADNNIGAARTIRSITFGADMDDVFQINNRTFAGGAAAILTLQADSGNASIAIDAGATGDMRIGWSGSSTAGGATNLGSNLIITHNGSGELLFNRQITGTGTGFTKLGTGTMRIAAFADNTFSGIANINAGRLIMGNTNTASASADFLNASAINLGGGTLEMRTTVGVNKVITNTTVSSASILAFNNTTTASRALTLDTGSMALNADLTVQNISSDTTQANQIIINRAITGTGDLIVDGYNTFTGSTTDFTAGRVALGGNNSGWSGDLVIREGSAQIFGDTAAGAFSAGTGGVILGETGNTAGAAFLLAASTPTAGAKTLSNDIIVRSGGFRTIRGGSDHTYNLNGNITLEGDLNVHNGLFFTDKNMILNGDISGAGGLSITESGSPNFTRLTGNNTYSGATSIGAGAVLNILSASANAIGDSSAVTFAGAGSVLVFNSTNETVGSIASSGTDGAINLGANTLTTGGDNSSTSYGGTINGTGGGLTKTGTGTMTLTGANTYTGNTAVTSGKLVVNGSIGASAVTVSGAGTVLATDAAASFGSTLAIQSGSILAAGDAGTAGTATVTGTTTFNNGSIFSWDINSSGTSYDKLATAGLVDGDAAGGSIFRIVASDATFADAFWNTTRTWADIFTTDGTIAISDWANTFTSVTVVNSSFASVTPTGGSFTASGNTLTWTAVPEPTSALVGLLIAAGLVRRRK